VAVRRGLTLDLDFAAAAQLVFDAYLDFLTTPVDPAERSDPKNFAAWNAAGRSAMAHIADIEKRAEAAGDPAQIDAVGAILAEARRCLTDDPTDAKEDRDGEPGGES
jgi:hypothetical protein